MRILICHGYLLSGTGSNQYVQSLARALCRGGHHVIVMCQDDNPAYDFVSSYLREGPRTMKPEVVWEKDTDYPGTCMVYCPDIGELLPVYVMDSYRGFEVKEFPELDEAELGNYIESNRSALSRLVEQFVPDAVQANHVVMLPYIIRPVAERYGVPYFVSIHGSALDFTVRKDPRYLAFAAEGLNGAAGVFVPSDYSAAGVLEVMGEACTGLEEKISTIPPGVDVDVFDLAEGDESEAVNRLLEKVEERTRGVTVGDFSARFAMELPEEKKSELEKIDHKVGEINRKLPDWMPELGIAENLTALARSRDPFVVFIGKLLETKGVQCVLPALPLLIDEYPTLRLVVIGFGELRGLLELMINALNDGDLERLRELCEYGNQQSRRVGSPFGPVLSFLDRLEERSAVEDYLRMCYDVDFEESIIFTGYLTQDEHRFLLPYARSVLVPSLAPEAFGLVATEAMACGVVPVASYHTGLETALQPVLEVWGEEAPKLLLESREDMVSDMAEACDLILRQTEQQRIARGLEIRAAAGRLFSWDSVAGRMVDLFQAATNPSQEQGPKE